MRHGETTPAHWGPRSLSRLGILAVAEVMLQQAVTAQEGGGTVQAPRFEVDPFWPKPLPNHWVLGQTIGVWVDEQDVIWIVHRGSATLADNEKALELKNGECCAAAPPVLAFDAERQPGALVGRARAGLRLAHCQPRHLRRSPGQRLDRRQRPRRLAPGEVHQGRQVPRSSSGARTRVVARQRAGAADLRRRQQRPAELRPHREDLRRPEGERGVPRRRLSQQARGGHRRDERQDEALLGRIRQQAGRHAGARLRSGGAARQAVPQSGPLRDAVQRRIAVRVRSQQRSPPGVQARWHVRPGGIHCARHEGVRLGVGRGVLARSAAAISLRQRRDEQPRVRAAATRSTCSRASATAAASRDSSSACTASRPTRRATSTPPKRGKESACRSSCTAASTTCRGGRRASSGRGPTHSLPRTVWAGFTNQGAFTPPRLPFLLPFPFTYSIVTLVFG